MVNKYNNPRLFNTVLTGPGMNHPRNPHVVIGSDTKGFIQGDMMDANAVMETIDQKIDVDNLIDDNKLTTAVNNAVESILGDVTEDLNTFGKVSHMLQWEEAPNSWDTSTIHTFFTDMFNDSKSIPGKKWKFPIIFQDTTGFYPNSGMEDTGDECFVEITNNEGDGEYKGATIYYRTEGQNFYIGCISLNDVHDPPEAEIDWNTNDLNQKQDTLVSGTNIKTVNGQSLLGSGNINTKQNVFGTVKVNSTDLAADSTTDTLTITAGSNIILTPNAQSDSFSIGASIPQSDYNQYDDTKDNYIKNRPLKLSDLYDDINNESPKLGDYLYSDYTWGTSSTGAIGICAGTPDMFSDGYARFIPFGGNFLDNQWQIGGAYGGMNWTGLLWSSPTTENIQNLSDEDGDANTATLISHVTSNIKYPAAEFCRQQFGGKGYLPTIKELYIAWPTLKNMSYQYAISPTQIRTINFRSDENVLTSEQSGNRQYVYIIHNPVYYGEFVATTSKTNPQAWVIPFIKIAPVKKNSMINNTLYL